MPIAAALTPLKTQLESASNAGTAGTAQSAALQITTAVASAISMGLFPVGSAFIVPPPAGFSACQAQLAAAFSAGVSGTPSSVGTMIASAIASLSPIVPPVGLSLLQTQLNQIFSSGMPGTPPVTSLQIASAIITYFQTGLVI